MMEIHFMTAYVSMLVIHQIVINWSMAAIHSLCTAYVSLLVKVTNQGGMATMHFTFTICIHANDKPDSFTVTNERVRFMHSLYIHTSARPTSVTVKNLRVNGGNTLNVHLCIYASDKPDSLESVGGSKTIHVQQMFLC